MKEDEYLDLIRQVAIANQNDIRQTLVAARKKRDLAADNLAEAERQVLSFEFLLSLVNEPCTPTEKRMALHDAMKVVLESTPGRRMPAGDLAREIDRRGLYKMRDGRAVESQQIHARANNYDNIFNRNDRGIGLN